MLTCHDWYATFAALAGAARRIPADRPVDSIDASRFVLGHSAENARKSVMFFGPDGGLMSVKWRNVKTVIRYSDGVDKPIVTPQFPMFFDLGSDPHEEHNLFSARLDMGWMMIPAFKAIGEFQQSVAQYPNIKPGQDFDGYGPSQADAIATDAHATGASEHEPANASGHPPAAPAGDPRDGRWQARTRPRA
jgi:arylsulfatase